MAAQDGFGVAWADDPVCRNGQQAGLEQAVSAL